MEHLFPVQHSYLIPLLPLIGAAIAGFFGARWLKGNSHWPIWIGVGCSAILSLWLLFGMLSISSSAVDPHGDGHKVGENYAGAPIEGDPSNLTANVVLYQWIASGDFKVDVAFWFDPLTAVMLCVVTGIGFLITVFAAGYMKGEEGYWRFFAYLGLFIFMMCMLVMGNNLIMLYLGWEGVGLCSYLLIGYYYQKPSARDAAKKAFLVNRVGDFGFGLGIMLCFAAFGTITYFTGAKAGAQGLLELAQDPTHPGRWALAWIPFLLMMGAFGKSAQFPLHVWLPDAMEGPTPVSALIHAATMVTAGVYMIARCGTLFVQNAAAMWTIAIIGCFTALMAGTIALRQFDLKKVFAYSTISQLGFMFVAVGCLAPVAGVFHLVTHAFFKALLFLSSGVVMHAMAGELDLRKMSGLKQVLPKTRWLMLIGCAALAGLPPLAGFFSKDEIIAASWSQSRVLAALMLLAALLTAYYTFRLYFRVFEGPLVVPTPPPKPEPPDHGHAHDDHGHAGHDSHAPDSHGHDDHGHHNHEPAIMMLPLALLALGAIVAGIWLGPLSHHGLATFLGKSPSFADGFNVVVREVDGKINFPPLQFGQHVDEKTLDPEFIKAHESLHTTVMFASIIVAGLGVWFAYLMHLKDRAAADRIAAQHAGVVHALESKWWFDEIYAKAIVEPLRTLGNVFFAMDRIVVDGIVFLISFIPQASGFALKLTTQRGYLQGYAVTMLFGVAVILIVVFAT